MPEARGADAIFIGVQSLDYSGYPDCRPQFIDAFQKVIDLGTKDTTKITLFTPFIHMTKTDILRTGLELGVPYEHTWSCYRNEGKACGTCGSCHFRKEAFDAIGRKDPDRIRGINGDLSRTETLDRAAPCSACQTGLVREKVIVHPSNAVAILPIEGKQCKLIRQYRYAIDDYIFEAPAGALEEGEDPLAAAGRELIEETGFAARTIEPRGFIITTPGYTDEKIFLYEAHGLSPSQEYRER